jgi:hypothetical protein
MIMDPASRKINAKKKGNSFAKAVKAINEWLKIIMTKNLEMRQIIRIIANADFKRFVI